MYSISILRKYIYTIRRNVNTPYKPVFRDKNPAFSTVFPLILLAFTPPTWYNKHELDLLKNVSEKPLLNVFAALLQRLFVMSFSCGRYHARPSSSVTSFQSFRYKAERKDTLSLTTERAWLKYNAATPP